MGTFHKSSFLNALDRLHQTTFFLLLVLLPTQLGLHMWPSWTMILGRRVDYLSPTVYLTDVLIVLTVGIHILKHALSRSLSRYLNPTAWTMIPLFFLCANAVLAIHPVVSLYQLIKISELSLFVWYILVSGIPHHRLRTGLAIAIVWSVALACIQLALQRSVGGLFWFLGERTFSPETLGIAKTQMFSIPLLQFNPGLILRPYGTFPHPNVLGGFLALILPFFVYSGKKQDRLFVIIIMVGIFASLSKSAIVVAFFTLLNSLSNRRSLSSSRAMLSAGIVTAVLLTLLELLTQYLPQGLRDLESVDVRGKLAHAALLIWRDSPLWGVGGGGFLLALPSFIPTKTISFLQPVHNAYLLILAEYGLIGLLFLFYGLWILVKKLANISSNWTHVAFFSFCILSSVDHYLITLQQGQLITALFVGLTIASLKRGAGKSTP